MTPVYPQRWRVVLADGRVGHCRGPIRTGPWVALGEGWATPDLLVRQGDHWRDPADYLYAYEPLSALVEEPEETDLPEGVITLERGQEGRCWRTDNGFIACDLDWEQALQIYPQLCKVGRGGPLVNLERVRGFGPAGQGGWLELDNGERFHFGMGLYHPIARTLGTDSLSCVDQSIPEYWSKLRDFPYDLTTAAPERIRRDCPTPDLFLCNLIFQVFLQHQRAQSNDYGTDTRSFVKHPLTESARRCGYTLGRKELTVALAKLVHQGGFFRLRDLGFRELEPERRNLGKTYPAVLLISPQAAARRAAEEHGVSLLLSELKQDRLPLEYLLPEIQGPIQLVVWKLPQAQLEQVMRILGHLERPLAGPTFELASLDELAERLKNLPAPWTAAAPEPFRRIPLQARDGLVYADPEEIASWSPTRPNRWQVVLADGRVLHHPGPVPNGPWVALGDCWLQPGHLVQRENMWVDPGQFTYPYEPVQDPLLDTREPLCGGPDLPAAAEEIVALQGQVWLLQDGRQIEGPQSPDQHPGLVRLGQSLWVRPNRVRFSQTHHQPNFLRLDGNHQVPLYPSRFVHDFAEAIGVYSLDTLAPDRQGLRFHGLRNYPYEIARASAAQLRSDFASLHELIANVLWQAFLYYQKTGKVPYGNAFSAFFYRPLQAILYRAGYLTRAQMRAPLRALSAKDRIYQFYCKLLTRMVYRYRLFNYRQLGFKDAFPELRVLGSQRVHQILLVEKGDQLEEFGRRLQAKYGVTLLVLKGMPSLLASEYFAEALARIYDGAVEILFLGDFDYAGWDIGPAFQSHLNFYGLECSRLERLVLPSVFTPQEIALFSRPLRETGPAIRGRIRKWLQESGGINGEARGIHANWLFPYERVEKRLEELL